jgi:hypothetical protein
MVEKKTYITNFLLFFTLILVFCNTYNLHKEYPFPYHHDEWQHLAISNQIIDKNYNIKQNPYFGEQLWHTDLESGFHLYVAQLFVMTGINPIFNYQFLPALFAVITAFLFYLVLSEWTKNRYVGVAAAVLFAFLGSNVNILGKDYFVPISFVFPLLLSFIYFWYKSIDFKSKKYLFISLGVYFTILLVHPPSFVILLFPIFFSILKNLKTFRKVYSKRILLITSIILLLSIILFLKDNVLESFRYLLNLIYFELGWGKLEIKYSIPMMYGIVNSILALIGIFYSKNKKLLFFSHLVFISLAICTFFVTFGFSVLVPYPRAVQYSMFFMIPLSSYGLLICWKKVCDIKKYRNIEFTKYKFFIQFVQLTLILIFITGLFFPKYDLDNNYKRYTYPVVTQKEYMALKWIDSQYEDNSIVLTPYFMTSAVYPISKNKVMSLIPAPLSGGNTTANLNFFTFDCQKQLEIIENSSVNLVVSRSKMNCNFYKNVYDNETYVYEIIG